MKIVCPQTIQTGFAWLAFPFIEPCKLNTNYLVCYLKTKVLHENASRFSIKHCVNSSDVTDGCSSL